MSKRIARNAGLAAKLALVVAASVLCSACASQANPNPPAQHTTALSGRPNGLALRADDGALFATDDAANQVLVATDAGAFKPYAAIAPMPGQPNSLGQIAVAADGTLYVARFGFGSAGAIVRIDSGGQATILLAPNPSRRRLGLVSIGPGQVLSSWFAKQGNAPSGGVSVLTVDPARGIVSERDLVDGLAKPVGIAVSGDTLWVADQQRGAIFKASLAALRHAAQPASAMTELARVASPDLLALGGTDVFTKCNASDFCKITAQGVVTVVATGFQDARGAAVDARRHVLYVVDRARGGGTSYLRTVPLSAFQP